MSQVVDFLIEAKTYYFATVEGDQPRVRPFGGAMERNGKVYLATTNQKKVYQHNRLFPAHIQNKRCG